jgi:NAD-reducing hydrogenase large subunit
LRTYDPCLSCSTHAFGKMPLHVRLVRADGTLVAERIRGSEDQ